MILNKIDIENVEREYCRRSLAAFAKQAWHVLEPAAPLKWGWCLDAICQHLEAVTNGEINRLLMNVPPGPMRDDSIIETSRGFVQLKDIVYGDEVLTHKGRYREVTDIHHQGMLPILKITTHSGREVFAAPTHPFLTPNGWVKAEKLSENDVLAVVTPQEERRCYVDNTTKEEARLLGYLIADGGLKYAPVFTNCDDGVISDFLRCCKILGFKTHVSCRDKTSVIGLRGSRDWLKHHGLFGSSSYTKRIPKEIMNGSREIISNFLGAYWSCDGSIDVRETRSRGSIYRAFAATVSIGLANDLLYALTSVGIEGRIRKRHRVMDTKAQPGGVYHYYHIEIQKETMTARILNLPFLCKTKRDRASDCRLDFDKVLWEDHIVSIEEQPKANCMCLTVEEDHSFTCSGIAVKNSMKSLLTGVLWPAWEWGPRNMPEMRFVGTAHEEQLAIRDSRKCRDLIKSEWYQNLWPLELSRDLDGKKEFGNTHKGVRQARAFTSLTGTRADRVLLDDPISADAANSEAKLEAARISFTETLPTRINSDKSAIVVIMQRLHEKDVSGVIDEMGLPYVHLVIPMRFEPGRRCHTSIGWSDPRTTEGELMFPERFSEAQVSELEKTLGSYGTAGQLQQRPAPRGGGILKESWFKFWTKEPRLEFRTIHADTAQKTAEQNDYSVFQCWGRSLTGEAVLLDQIRGKWEAPELLVQCRAFWRKHLAAQTTAKLRGLHVEDKSSGTGLVQTLRREGIPILAVQRNNDKISRGYDAAPFIESGNVLLPADAPWLSDFLAEAASFPGGAHDDQMDPMFDAIATVQAMPALEPENSVAMPRSNRW